MEQTINIGTHVDFVLRTTGVKVRWHPATNHPEESEIFEVRVEIDVEGLTIEHHSKADVSSATVSWWVPVTEKIDNVAGYVMLNGWEYTANGKRDGRQTRPKHLGRFPTDDYDQIFISFALDSIANLPMGSFANVIGSTPQND